jgi:uncharacterized protein (TIGR02001 family)
VGSSGIFRTLAPLLIAVPALSATAQTGGGRPSLAVEATNDLRARGLSWSGGRPTVRAFLDLPITGGLGLEASAAALRGSRRHGGADAGFDIGGVWRGGDGPWTLSGGVVGHLFADRSALNYAEGQARAAYMIGPATLGLSAAYAPSQDAIGGDNLHVGADASIFIPATPITLDASVGHSSGGRNNSPQAWDRARRLRPAGDYWDFNIGLTYVRAPWSLGLHLSDTSIDSDRLNTPAPYLDRDVGRRFIASLTFEL